MNASYASPLIPVVTVLLTDFVLDCTLTTGPLTFDFTALGWSLLILREVGKNFVTSACTFLICGWAEMVTDCLSDCVWFFRGWVLITAEDWMWGDDWARRGRGWTKEEGGTYLPSGAEGNRGAGGLLYCWIPGGGGPGGGPGGWRIVCSGLDCVSVDWSLSSSRSSVSSSSSSPDSFCSSDSKLLLS